MKKHLGTVAVVALATLLAYALHLTPAQGFSGSGSGGNGGGITGCSGDINAGCSTVTKTNGTSFATSATTDTTNAANITSGLLATARGGTNTGTPAATNTQLLTSGTTYTVPIGTTSLEFIVCGAGGGGGASTTGGSAALSGGGGGGASCSDTFLTNSLASSYTYTIGAAGTAGGCAGAPAAAGAGGTTTLNIAYPAWAANTVEAVGNVITDGTNQEVVTAVSSDAKTGGSAPSWSVTQGGTTSDNHVTWVMEVFTNTLLGNGGGAGGTSSTTVAGTAGGAGGAPGGTVNRPLNSYSFGALAGAAGSAGNSSSTPAQGANQRVAGGASASVNASGACISTATPGAVGMILARAFGAF